MFPVLWPQLFFRPPQVSNQSTLAIDQTLLSATSTQDTKNTHESLSCNTTPQLQGLSFSHLNFGPAYPPTPALPALRRQATGCEGMAAASASSWNERRDEILHVNHSMGSSVKMSICNIPINWEVFYLEQKISGLKKKTEKNVKYNEPPVTFPVSQLDHLAASLPWHLGTSWLSWPHQITTNFRKNSKKSYLRSFEKIALFQHHNSLQKVPIRNFRKKNCMLKLCTLESRVEAIEAV